MVPSIGRSRTGKLIYDDKSQTLATSGRSELPIMIHEKTFWDDVDILYPNPDGGYMGIYNCQK